MLNPNKLYFFVFLFFWNIHGIFVIVHLVNYFLKIRRILFFRRDLSVGVFKEFGLNICSLYILMLLFMFQLTVVNKDSSKRFFEFSILNIIL